MNNPEVFVRGNPVEKKLEKLTQKYAGLSLADFQNAMFTAFIVNKSKYVTPRPINKT